MTRPSSALQVSLSRYNEEESLTVAAAEMVKFMGILFSHNEVQSSGELLASH